MTVTEALKRFRKENKITQKEIAEHLGITQQTYQYYESKGGIPAELIKKIASKYQVSTDYLLGFSDNLGGGKGATLESDLRTLAATVIQSSQALTQSAQALQKILDNQE